MSETAAQARHPELASYLQQHVLQRGQFTLASGRTSSYYLDGKLASLHPQGSRLIADAILKELDACPVDALGGMDMGGTPICGAVAVRSAERGAPLPTFVARKDVKEHGTRKELEGPVPDAGARVAIVDDVVTSGGSIVKAIEAARRAGYQVVLAIAVVDRRSGAAELMQSHNVPYQPLVDIHELGVSND